MSKWMPTLRRLGRWFLRKTALVLLTSLLFMISFTLFQYASWDENLGHPPLWVSRSENLGHPPF
ncbi:hypothetical protein [Aeromonas bestiarum]|uniref:hypothetical protein n=1 Tax=Aeromonas bestiarum TaxID=105751 RepID=UPI000F0A30A9|nr:hypothetical protein [Aeromonas bestiarum]